MLQGLSVIPAPPRAETSELLEWSDVKSSGALLSVYRAKVPGGWLVYACNGYHHHGGVTFYPDPTHSWADDAGR
jgi:hypothetical protein